MVLIEETQREASRLIEENPFGLLIGHPEPETLQRMPFPELVRLYGGKGAGLIKMTELGLPVPQAVVLNTNAWREFNTWQEFKDNNESLPPELKDQIELLIKALEQKTGHQLGNPENPLFVSVRSGAPVSMPGAMDTFLNVGINDQTVEALAKITGEETAYRMYFKLIKNFGIKILGIAAEEFPEAPEETPSSIKDLQSLVVQAKQIISNHGFSFPEDPLEQIQMAVAAVFVHGIV